MAFSKHPTWMYALVGLILGVGAVLLYVNWDTFFPPTSDPNVYHVHANFAVFIHSEKIDFAQEKYMESKTHALSKYVHLHDLDGETIHFHARNISLQYFFQTLDMDLTENCLVNDANESFCSNDTDTLNLWVNGKPIENGFAYVPADLDRILISYGNETQEQLLAQMNQVTDTACIQSEKCPERGKPSDESSCAGSGECGVGNIPVGE